jgi:hypothetical protein
MDLTRKDCVGFPRHNIYNIGLFGPFGPFEYCDAGCYDMVQ